MNEGRHARPETGQEHSDKRLTFYTLVLVFAVCCVLGYLVELGWCFVQLGHLESRKSLLYGPLSVAYGLGGLVLTVALYRLRQAPAWRVFVVAFVVGSLVEYICSWGQETFFHAVAWDYSNLPLNINGRVCLYYSLFWGALGVAWVKLVLPLIAQIDRWIPKHIQRLLVWAFLLYFLVDCFLSATAALRMQERRRGEAPSNAYERLLDQQWPDERIQSVYANSKRVDP